MNPLSSNRFPDLSLSFLFERRMTEPQRAEPSRTYHRQSVHPISRKMSNPSVPTLKRPRSTSTPPSPSSTSSPKRAASEDPFPSSSDSGRGNDFLTPNMQAGNAASSPLRLDFHDEPEQAGEGESGWVRRTEEVHLSSDGVDDGRERLRGQYNELLGERGAANLGRSKPDTSPWLVNQTRHS